MSTSAIPGDLRAHDIGVLGVISKPFDLRGTARQVMDLYRKNGG